MPNQTELRDFEDENRAENRDFIHVLTDEGTVIEIENAADVVAEPGDGD